MTDEQSNDSNRGYNVELLPHAYAVRIDDEGRPKTVIAPYGGFESPCRVCPARCCHSKVNVSLPYALRFSRVLQVPIFSGLTVVSSDHPEHAFRLDPDPRWPETPWEGRAELALRRNEDGGCHALTDIGGYRRCGVYAARPSFCRTYPARWTSDVAKGGPAKVHCPVPYGITDAHAEELVVEIERSIDEWTLHDRVVAEWNKREGPFTIEAFLRFAVPLVTSETAPAPDAFAEGTPQERLHEAMVRQRIASPGPAAGPRPWAGLPIVE
ncbi:MAG: YkgJ family cysteine cluster protein [Myxococcota bacterium]